MRTGAMLYSTTYRRVYSNFKQLVKDRGREDEKGESNPDRELLTQEAFGFILKILYRDKIKMPTS